VTTRFEAERFLERCRAAVRDKDAIAAVREVVIEAV